MAAAPRSESIGIIYEISLIDRFQYPDEPRLHQLVLQRRDTQRPLLRASRLRDVHPANRLWNIRPPVQPFYQAGQVGFQIISILFLGDSVDARGGSLPQSLEAPPLRSSLSIR